MRKILITASIIAGSILSCENKGYGPKIKARLVHLSCATAVVQVLDSAHHHLGAKSWQQSNATPVYNHVFAVENQCSFKTSNMKVGEEFYFRLTNNTEEDCVVCMLWDNPPTVTQNIIVLNE